MIKVKYNWKEIGEINSGEIKTQPGMVASIAQISQRLVRNVPVIQNNCEYDEDPDIDNPLPNSFDLTDIQKNSYDVSELTERKKEKEEEFKSEKRKIEKKLKSMKDSDNKDDDSE